MSAFVADPIAVANLLRMAFYAGEMLDELELCEAAQDPGCHFVELLGGMLANAGMSIRRSGYLRGYHERQDCSSRPHGRLLLAPSIAQASIAYARLHHDHDDFDEDCPDNRVLKAAATVLLREPHRKQLAEGTRVDLSLLQSDLAAVAERRLDARLLSSLPKSPGARRYRAIRFIARLLAAGDQPDSAQGGDWARELLQDGRRMRHVFERFVFRFAKHEVPRGLRVHRLHYRWPHGRTDIPIDPRMPLLHPDVVVCHTTRTLVVECKYTPRILTSGPFDAAQRFRSAHLQQLFSYLSAESRRSHAPYGLLLYPRVGDAVRAEVHLGRFHTTIATLDLATPWPQLRTALLELLMTTTE